MVRHSAILCLTGLMACVSTTSAAVLTVGPGQTYSTVQAAVNAAGDGDTIEIYSATYTGSEGNASINKSNLTLKGVGTTRPILDAGGTSIENKGIWVVTGSDTIVEFIEFQDCSVPDHNGAGIRQEGDNLTVRDCYFHDNENGILGGGGTSSTVVIEYSEFNHNGFGNGYTHNMYIGNVGLFELRRCYVHHAYKGQEVKSRAQVNYVEYNRITNEDGEGNYEVDIPNGGTTYIIGNLIHQSEYCSNSGIINYAVEGATNPDQHMYVVNNTIVNDRGAGTFVRNASTTDCLLQNNIFEGTGTILNGPGTQVTNWVTNNAYLQNYGTYDYHLTASSTGAIDQGSDPGYGQGYSLTPVYQYVHPMAYEGRPSDATLDIGAYEYGGVALPNVQFDQMTSSGDESVTPASLTVSLSEASAQTVTVDYTVTGGDATGGGVDYTLAAGTLTFDPNEVSEAIDITIVDDSEEESDETIEVTLSNPSNAVLGPKTVHTYTILDNDGTGPIVLQDGLDGYTGTRDNYMQSSAPDSNFGAYERLRVTGYADVGDIQRGLARFDLSSVQTGTPIMSATFWLYSYDPTKSLGSTGFYGAYRLTCDWGEMASTWNSPWTTPGGDFESTPDATAPKQPPSAVPCWYSFDVTSRVQQWINDPSGNYGWVIKCTDEYSHNQDQFYQSDAADAVHRPKLVIVTGTEPAVQFDAVSSNGDESVSPASLSVSLNVASTDTVTVDYAVTGGSATGGGVDYTLAAGTLTFDPNDVSETIDITIVDDGDEEDDETIEVTLSNPSNAALGANTVHTYTILDNEGPSQDFADADIAVTGDVSGSYLDTHASDDVYESITEVRVGNPAKGFSALEHVWTIDVTGGLAVTFYVEAHKTASSDGDDFVFAYSEDDDTYIDMVTVTKTADDDTAQSYVLPSSLVGTVYIRVTDTDHTQGNQAMDTISVDQMYIESAGEPGEPTVEFDLVTSSGDESVTPASLAVSLSNSSDQTVTVDYTVTGGTATGGGVDYTLAAGTLTFDPNDVAKTIDISIVDDSEDESNETIEVTLSNPANATLGVNTVHTYTILDNDGVSPPGQASSPSPASGATKVSRSVILSWTAGSGADSHDVYFGTNPNPGASEFQGNQTETTFDPGYLPKNTWHYWRIDEVNAGGTTTGVVWSFKTGAS